MKQIFPHTLVGFYRSKWLTYSVKTYLSSINPRYKFGITKKHSKINGLYYYEANLEKSILDYIYLRKPANLEHIDLSTTKNFDIERYMEYASKYPKWVQEYHELLL